MRIIVALQHHFYKLPDGSIYTCSEADYSFWSKYLEVFDEVLVFARVRDVDKLPLGSLRSDGLGVNFFPLPDYLGPWGYMRAYPKLRCLAKTALSPTDACILRVSGEVGSLLWKVISAEGRPYGVEVVADPWDSLSPGSVRSVLRSPARLILRHQLVLQCRFATAAAYVTEYMLQRRYPPGGWQTSYSSAKLSDEDIISESGIQRRLESIERKTVGKETWRICYVGTLSQLYKAPDVLIKAVSRCVKKGGRLELVIVGDGQYCVEMEELAKKEGIGNSVKFMGYVQPGAKVFEQLDLADIYVLPSRQEGLPRSVIEAMARGLPCITSDVGGFQELVGSEWMVPVNDVQSLADRIERMLGSAEVLKCAVRENVKTASKYCTDELRKRRVEFYNKIKDVTEDWLRGAKD